MPELGNRANVMGPQPIAQRKQAPVAMWETAERVLELLAAGKTAELEAMAMPKVRSEVASLAAAVKPGAYSKHEITGYARVNLHYYIKARLAGVSESLKLQFRLGEHEGRWMIWDAINLSGRLSAWSR